MPRAILQGTKEHRAYLIGAWAFAVFVLLMVPFVQLPWIFGNATGQLQNWSRTLAFAVAILGLNLLIGYSGQISIGHSAFFGLGAYTTIITVADHHWSYFAALPLCFFLCFAIGCVVGLPALRIRGLYLVVVTFAMGIVFPTLVLRFKGVTGGANGKGASSTLTPPDWTPFDARVRIDPLRYRYYVQLIVAGVMFLVARNLIRSRAGRAMVAQRDNPTAAAVNGISVPINKVVIFGLSAGFCGVAGWILMVSQPFASDVSFSVQLSITLIIGLVLGGVATVSGAVPGAIVVVIVSYLFEQLTDAKKIGPLRMTWLSTRLGRGGIVSIVFGALLLIFVFVLPGGVIDGLRKIRARIVTVTPRPSWLATMTEGHPDRVTGATVGGGSTTPALAEHSTVL